MFAAEDTSKRMVKRDTKECDETHRMKMEKNEADENRKEDVEEMGPLLGENQVSVQIFGRLHAG